MTTQCQIATITITTEATGTFTLTVPAYQRSVADFAAVIEANLNRYFTIAMLVGADMNLADFALGLLAEAAKEPRWVE